MSPTVTTPTKDKDKGKSDKRKKGEEGSGKEDNNPTPSKQSKQDSVKTKSTEVKKITAPDSSSKKVSTDPKKIITAKTLQEMKKVEQKKDIYQEILKLELSESIDRARDEDEKLFKQTLEEIREKLTNIHKLRLSGGDEKTKLDQARMEIGLLFVKMKKLNRLEKLRLRTARENTNSSKHNVDQFNLQLQNLRYEVLHLKKEVNRCINFWSADEDIDLVDVNNFYAEAPKDVSKPDITKDNPHELRLARLVWELQTRKKLNAKANELEDSRNQQENIVTAKDEKVKELGKHLNNMLSMTKPIQKSLNMPLDAERKRRRLLELLPKPLNNIATCAGHLNLPRVTYDVEGEEKKAREWEGGNKGEGEGEEHPLTVVIKVKTEGGDELRMIFSYLTVRQIVDFKIKIVARNSTFTGEVLEASSLLTNLQLDALLPAKQTHNFESWIMEKMGKTKDDTNTYAWVQKVAGISIDPPGKEIEMSSNQRDVLIRSVVKATLERFDHRVSLQEQLNTMIHSKSFKQENIPKEIVNIYPQKIKSKLKSFEPFTWEQFCQNSEHSDLVTKGVIHSHDFLYKCVITRGIATLTGLIAVKASYPDDTPIFILTLAWKDRWNSSNNEWIRDLEREINIEIEEQHKNKSVLIHQVYKSSALLDVMLECISAMDPEPLFTKEHNFEVPVDGRQRKLPLVYDPVNCIFTTRS